MLFIEEMCSVILVLICLIGPMRSQQLCVALKSRGGTTSGFTMRSNRREKKKTLYQSQGQVLSGFSVSKNLFLTHSDL